MPGQHGQRRQHQCEIQHQRFRTEQIHQAAGQRRADRGADAVEQQQAAGDLQHPGTVDQIVHMRHADAVHRECQTTENDTQADQRVLVVPCQQPGDGGHSCAGKRHHEQHPAPVVPVREMAHRPLKHRTTQDSGRHEGGNAVFAEAHTGAEHMAQAQQRTAEHARDQGANHTDR